MFPEEIYACEEGGAEILTSPNLLIMQGEVGPVYVALLFFLTISAFRLSVLDFTEFVSIAEMIHRENGSEEKVAF